MTKFREKAQGQVKQMVGQMIGDQQLEQAGQDQLKKADRTGRDPRTDQPTENVSEHPDRNTPSEERSDPRRKEPS